MVSTSITNDTLDSLQRNSFPNQRHFCWIKIKKQFLDVRAKQRYESMERERERLIIRKGRQREREGDRWGRGGKKEHKLLIQPCIRKRALTSRASSRVLSASVHSAGKTDTLWNLKNSLCHMSLTWGHSHLFPKMLPNSKRKKGRKASFSQIFCFTVSQDSMSRTSS